MANIGLYFGSFNPVHIGHLLVATHIKEEAGLDQIWFIVSPLNPFKQNIELADEHHRLEMVKLAVETVDYFKVSDIEFHLEKPSYTHTTLKELSKQFPAHTFHLIIGEDNAAKFHQWKEAGWIEQNYNILIYNRELPNPELVGNLSGENIKFYSLPLFDISSTNIRSRVKNHQTIHYFVTKNVEQYITFHKLYY